MCDANAQFHGIESSTNAPLRKATDREGENLDELAVAAQGGDAAATERLYELARLRLVRVSLALGVKPDDVPDLVQEILLSGWRNLHRFDGLKGSFIGWLIPGLKGRIYNEHRARTRRFLFLKKLRTLTHPQEKESHDGPNALEARWILQKLLACLTARQREIVALYEIAGLNAREVAGLLGISEAGVRSVARDAKQRLRSEARRLEGERKNRGSLYAR